MHKLFEWLAKKIDMHMTSDGMLIDVGAYHGDFSENLLKTNHFTQAALFEPNPAHFALLKGKFAENNKIALYPHALGNETGTHEFNCSQDDATGSLLPYDKKYHHEDTQKTVQSFSVQVAKLDDLFATHFPSEKLSLLKIDTQGFDLEVLKGAEQILRTHKPWLVIELNFLSFYKSQAPIQSIFDYLSTFGYQLGGFFNDHYSSDEWLAFADGVFIPEGVVEKSKEPFYPRVFSDELLDQNKYLQKVCDERLALINVLNKEAENRLNIINTLTKKLDQGSRRKKIFNWL